MAVSSGVVVPPTPAEAADMPFQLPPSDVFQRSRRNIGVCLASFVASAAIATGSSGRFFFDPISVVASVYAVFLFCFQNFYFEWPSLSFKVLTIVVLGDLALLGPTILEVFGWRDQILARMLVWAVDAAIMFWTYFFMVRGPQCQDLEPGSLKGHVCIVTGCNTGIGYETAEALARAGASVVFACRTESKARDAMRRVVAGSGGAVPEDRLIFLRLDVSDFQSVRSFAREFEALGLPLHSLILNAGVMLSSRRLSVDGVELTMASNHFGHFLLLQLLLPLLLATEKKGQKPRIVLVGSNMCYQHGCFDFSEVVVCRGENEKAVFLRKPYSLFRAYGQSKLATLHLLTELDRRLRKAGSKIPVHAIHPGEVITEVMRDMGRTLTFLFALVRGPMHMFLKSATQGAACTLHVATAPLLATSDGMSGAFWVRLEPAPLGKAGEDATTAAKLWDWSMRVTAAPVVI